MVGGLREIPCEPGEELQAADQVTIRLLQSAGRDQHAIDVGTVQAAEVDPGRGIAVPVDGRLRRFDGLPIGGLGVVRRPRTAEASAMMRRA